MQLEIGRAGQRKTEKNGLAADEFGDMMGGKEKTRDRKERPERCFIRRAAGR